MYIRKGVEGGQYVRYAVPWRIPGTWYNTGEEPVGRGRPNMHGHGQGNKDCGRVSSWQKSFNNNIIFRLLPWYVTTYYVLQSDYM